MVVLIDEMHGVADGRAEPGLTSSTHTQVGLVSNEAEARVAASEGFDDRRAAIIAAIVNRDALPLPQSLALDVSQAAVERGLAVQDGQDE
jgi:hypothetical protein